MAIGPDGEFALEALPGLTSGELRAGIRAMEEELVGGPQNQIANALMELISATSRPPWMDDAVASAYMLAMPKAMWDYPIEIVHAACANWRRVPNHGRWWPTEADLRAQCETLFLPEQKLRNAAIRMAAQMEEEERRARQERPSPFASEKGKALRQALRERMSASRFTTYFANTMCFFQGDNAILVRARIAEDVIRREAGDLIEQLGVKVSYDPEPFRNMRLPQYEDNTPEEQVETARKMNRLKQAMLAREDIAALVRAGEI